MSEDIWIVIARKGSYFEYARSLLKQWEPSEPFTPHSKDLPRQMPMLSKVRI